MNTFYLKTIFLLLALVFFLGCTGDYDYRKTHNIKHDHSHHHDHHPDHHHHESETGQNTNISKSELELYHDKERELWQKPNLVLKMLGDISNKVVAEIGSASGYFTFRIAQKAKKTIGCDIDPDAIDFMEKEKRKYPEGFRKKIETRLAEIDDPKLKDKEVDVVVLVNTYIYIGKNAESRIEYFNRLKRTFKNGGMILIVDYKKKNLPKNSLAPDIRVRLALGEVEEELKTAGYKNITTNDSSLSYQYVVKAYVD